MGDVNRHPDWPRTKAVAVHRPQFDDAVETPGTSWLMIVIGKTGVMKDVTAAQVADWPDADTDWPTGEDGT